MKNTPVISLIGRQNVGKSTIFNRLLKSKKAIIDSTPGVTRDLITGEIDLDGIIIQIVDSGGISDDKDETNKLVQNKTKEAIKIADLVLFVVEAGNPVPIEEEYIDLVRKSNKKVILIMNKSDSPEKDVYLNEYFAYGLGEAIPISAAHNRNIDLMLDKILKNIKKIEIKTVNEEDADIKIAILGKPNVGKSSLLNKIINKERSIVSSIAGTTRDIIDESIIFDNKKFLLIDTAGIRKKSKVTEDVEYYSVNRAIKTINMADVVFLVIDSIENVSEQDKKIADQIVKNGKGLIILLNKWDLQKKIDSNFLTKKEELIFKFPIVNYVPIIPVSALTGEGIKTVLKKAVDIYNELHKRIDTSDLNKFIREIVKKYSPSSKKGVLKLYYATQTNKSPIEFVFFINNKKLLGNNYKQYITNQLRSKFGFSGVPITVIFRDKK